MGRGESVVGITSKQVRSGFNGTNYDEQVESLGVFGDVVQLVGFRSWLVEGGRATVGDPKWHYPCWHVWNGHQWTILVGGEGYAHKVLKKGLSMLTHVRMYYRVGDERQDLIPGFAGWIDVSGDLHLEIAAYTLSSCVIGVQHTT